MSPPSLTQDLALGQAVSEVRGVQAGQGGDKLRYPYLWRSLEAWLPAWSRAPAGKTAPESSGIKGQCQSPPRTQWSVLQGRGQCELCQNDGPRTAQQRRMSCGPRQGGERKQRPPRPEVRGRLSCLDCHQPDPGLSRGGLGPADASAQKVTWIEQQVRRGRGRGHEAEAGGSRALRKGPLLHEPPQPQPRVRAAAWHPRWPAL